MRHGPAALRGRRCLWLALCLAACKPTARNLPSSQEAMAINKALRLQPVDTMLRCLCMQYMLQSEVPGIERL